jgi:hypothetical protein
VEELESELRKILAVKFELLREEARRKTDDDLQTNLMDFTAA